MAIFRNMTIKFRFSVVMGLIVLTLIIQGIILSNSNDNIRRQALYISNIEIPILNKAHELKLTVVQVQQWLTDISATRALNGLNDGFDEAEINAQKFKHLISELIVLDSENKQTYESMIPTFDSYYSTGISMAQAYIDEGPEAGNQQMADFDTVAAAMAATVDDFLIQSISRSNEALETEENLLYQSENLLIGSVVMIFTGIIILFVLMKSMLKALSSLPVAVNKLSEGNLTLMFDINGDDEISHIMSSLSVMQEKISNMVKHIQDTAVHLHQTVESLSQKSSDANRDAQQLYSETDLVATAMNEMSSTVSEVAQNISHSAEAVDIANKETGEGKRLVDNTINEIRSLSENINTASDTVRQLEQDSASISTILEVIQSIAEQTNLLALNAAIEAARAGDQGRGFAVVADEVRTLAGRTQQSTEEIKNMIDKLQSESKQAVEAMSKSCEKATSTVDEAQSAGTSLSAISESISKINDMSMQISHAAKEQNLVAEEVNQSVVKIHDMAQLTANESNDTVTLSAELLSMSLELEKLTEQFKV